MEMTTPQRVDVARQVFAGIPLHEAISLARRYAGSENKLRPRLSQTLESLAEALPALLQQLADYDELGETITMMGREIADLKMQVLAAERAREDASSLLYEADAYLCTARIAAETRDRIAAFLAANGGARED